MTTSPTKMTIRSTKRLLRTKSTQLCEFFHFYNLRIPVTTRQLVILGLVLCTVNAVVKYKGVDLNEDIEDSLGNYLTEPLEVSRAKYMDATHISVEEHKEIPNPTKPCDAEPACHFGKIYRINQRDDGILNQVLRGMKHCPSAAQRDGRARAMPKREPNYYGYCATCECTGRAYVSLTGKQMKILSDEIVNEWISTLAEFEDTSDEWKKYSVEDTSDDPEIQKYLRLKAKYSVGCGKNPCVAGAH